MSHEFLTPVGRLVSGSFFEPQKSDHQGKPKEESDWNYYVGMAFPKTAANWWDEQGELGAVFNALRAAASEHYRGQENVANFKWKIDDGDSPKHAEKSGYPGHWILKFNRQHSIGACPVYNNQNPPQVIVDPQQAKRGHWYRISGSSKANGATGDQAGVYVNMSMAQWCAHGEEIVGGPSASQVFGAAPSALPAGASTQPLAPAAAMPAAPGAPPAASSPATPAALPQTPPAAASPAPAAAPAQQPGTVPAPNFATGGGYDPAPAAPAAAPVEEKYQYAGGAYSKAALLQAGHTEAMIATYPKA